MHITIQELSKSFGGRDILSAFSLEIQSGMRLCICGPNGSGKSTFIKLLANEEAPDGGRIILPKGCRLGYVEQELNQEKLDTKLLSFVVDVLPDWNDFWEDWERAAQSKDEVLLATLAQRQAELEQVYGYNPEHRAKTVLSGLGFSEDKWERTVGELSGGWRERAKLARVLTAGADVLLLDEPTNHLDLDAVEWLESFLHSYEGVLAFVAHDRVFMDRVGTHVLYFSGGNEKPIFRKVSFSKFVELQAELSEQRVREATRIQGEIDRKMDFVRRFGAKATKARQAGSRQKMAKKLEKELDGLQNAPRRKELKFKWPESPQPDRVVLSVSDLKFSFPDGQRMWDTLSFSLYRGQKVALTGPNGCGKSTLLKLLVNKLEKEQGTITFGPQVKVGYFSQHQLDILHASGTVLSEIRRLTDPRNTEEELMSVLGLFLLGEQYFDRVVSSLSGGEKNRLVLSILFLGRSNCLILDEPTNHLDLESREALIDALTEYDGTLLMVAHDRHLLTEAAEQIWELSSQGVAVYTDGFTAYNDSRKERKYVVAQEESEKNSATIKRTMGLSKDELKKVKREQAEARNKLYKEMRPLQEEYTKLEKELERSLEEQTRVEALLADPDIYAEANKATELLKNYHELQATSEKILENMAGVEECLKPYEEKKAALLEEI